jgi:hypothetical protein
MRRLGSRELVLPFLIVAAVVYLFLRRDYGSLPPIQVVTAFPLAALAIGEFVAARRVRAAITHRPGSRPMAALVIARCIALGRASALVAAGVLGAVVALLVRVAPDVGQVNAAHHDFYVGLSVGIATLALLVGGIVLERAGIDPSNPSKGR